VTHEARARAAARLIRDGQPVFTPVVQGHSLVPYDVLGILAVAGTAVFDARCREGM